MLFILQFLSFVLLALSFGWVQLPETAHTTPPEAHTTSKNGTVVDSLAAITDTTSTTSATSAATAAGIAGSTYDAIDSLTIAHVVPDSLQSNIDQNNIVAFYGHPDSRKMGILGRFPIDTLHQKLTVLANEYDLANGARGVKKAFYLIYATAWPEGEIGYMSDKKVKKYIDFAAQNNMIVILDHQIGKYDPVASLRKMLRWLAYPNVHLALDPEWRTTRPMKEIGSVSADEINSAQRAMKDYMVQNAIPGERLLVVHQFNAKMISQRERVATDSVGVRLIHCADGFGTPGQKRSSYAYNAKATNIPDKGFKLFYNFGTPGAGYDKPLLTPEQVCALSPHPAVIIYQ
jgi:hypothetical protein